MVELSMVEKPKDSIHPATRTQLRVWLEKNHGRESGLWLVLNKKGTGKSIITYDEVVEELLCFGWVDSKPNKLDEDHSLLWMAPRKTGSNWSRLNKERIEKLIALGLMTPPGMLKIEQAKADGSWSALDLVESLELPDDLVAALRSFPDAFNHFSAFPRSVKRNILEWILNAKKPETRNKRIQETSELASQNIRANQWRDRR